MGYLVDGDVPEFDAYFPPSAQWGSIDADGCAIEYGGALSSAVIMQSDSGWRAGLFWVRAGTLGYFVHVALPSGGREPAFPLGVYSPSIAGRFNVSIAPDQRYVVIVGDNLDLASANLEGVRVQVLTPEEGLILAALARDASRYLASFSLCDSLAPELADWLPSDLSLQVSMPVVDNQTLWQQHTQVVSQTQSAGWPASGSMLTCLLSGELDDVTVGVYQFSDGIRIGSVTFTTPAGDIVVSLAVSPGRAMLHVRGEGLLGFARTISAGVGGRAGVSYASWNATVEAWVADIIGSGMRSYSLAMPDPERIAFGAAVDSQDERSLHDRLRIADQGRVIAALRYLFEFDAGCSATEASF